METSNIILFYKGQSLNKGQNGQKTMGPKRVRYSEVPLYQLFKAKLIDHFCVFIQA